ncbi:cupin domain-containing protein [Mycobacterium sp. AMU20-3851]|uniref:cupin domain-containing protein n=1 Tax=Mycobacterium sp. AMU20-3851 TaxID=3122055 RepID=UPI003754D12D
MEKISLTALAREHLEKARAASSGRSAHTVYGGHEHSLRQTLLALTAGNGLDDHESPGEATLQVLQGRIRLSTDEAGWEGSAGDHLVVPRTRHALAALEDSVIVLTVVKQVGPHI